MKVNIVNLKNQVVGDLDLSDSVFGLEPRVDIISRVVRWQLAKVQSGLHQAKVRSEVAGSTKKIVKQKGSGGARHGSKRGAQFRGGGIIFGPVMRSHAHNLPKKVRALGLKMALSYKHAAGKLCVIDTLDVQSAKTQEIKKSLKDLGVGSTLFIDAASVPQSFSLATRNLHNVDVLPATGANVYDIIRHDTVYITSAGVELLKERFQ